MQVVHADLERVLDGDTLIVNLETPLVVDVEADVAWPEGQRDVDTAKSRYSVWDQITVRVQNLDTHETPQGEPSNPLEVRAVEEKQAFKTWLDAAEGEWDESVAELEIFSPGADPFKMGTYDRLLAMVARKSDGDDWDTSALSKFGNSVAWVERTPR